MITSSAGSVSSGSVPSGSVPSGSVPSGSVPSGSVPSGSVPSGSVPSGSVPSGSVPSGSVPSGSVPSGSVPSGSVPSGSVPSGSVPSGSVPSGSVPSGAVVGSVSSRSVSFSPVVPPTRGVSSSSAARAVMGRLPSTRHRARTQAKKVLSFFIYVPSFVWGIYTVIIFQTPGNFKQIPRGSLGNIRKSHPPSTAIATSSAIRPGPPSTAPLSTPLVRAYSSTVE